jgi:hypothetical protein
MGRMSFTDMSQVKMMLHLVSAIQQPASIAFAVMCIAGDWCMCYFPVPAGIFTAACMVCTVRIGNCRNSLFCVRFSISAGESA